MLASGVLVAWFVSFMANDGGRALIATLLAVCIVLYDGVLKRTPVAPLVMGACRSLNVLLGMSLAHFGKPTADSRNADLRPWHLGEWLIAAGIGVYIVGVTIFCADRCASELARAADCGAWRYCWAEWGCWRRCPCCRGFRR